MKLKIPGSGSQITLRQFMDYHNAVDDCERVMVIINKSREYCESLKADSIETIITLFEEVIDSSASNFERVITVNGKRLGFIPDINSMTFREHVDLDELSKLIWFKDNDVNYKEFPRLMAILFRPVTEQVGEFYNIQKYDLSKMNDYLPEIMGLTLDRVNGALLFFFDYRRSISEQFFGLFGQSSDEGGERDNTPSGLSRWGWYHILQSVSNNDITNHEKVLDKGAREIFTYLSYMRDYNAEQARIMKQAIK